MRVLVVEDDVQLAEMLTEALTDRQYVVDVAEDGEMAWDWVSAWEYDLVVLDLTLPKLDGVKLCQRLRQQNTTLPILMVTARDTVADKIIGLDAGADDYVVKPFDLQELMARIRALLRRGSVAQAPGLAWGSLRLDSSTFEVSYDNTLVHLTPKEFAILEVLLSSGRRVLSRSNIIERIWSLEEPPTEETIKTHIKSLRHKLKAVGAPEDLIETVHGLGYRLKQIQSDGSSYRY
ncbi:response regulator transcription factor [Phormidium tenue FACHB-886]|nr:response regulator transcription factor [Phormidium tenue FACHB-886]